MRGPFWVRSGTAFQAGSFPQRNFHDLMRRLLLAPLVLASLFWVAPLTVLSACSGGGGGGTGAGGGAGGGGGGGGGDLEPFSIITLDPDVRGVDYLAAAFDPSSRRVGVVYYAPAGTETMAGHPDFFIKYVEWQDGVTKPIETIRTVQNKVGLTVAFNPTSGEPTVSYLGGDPGFVVGMSIFWFQSDAVINQRNNGTWTETIIAQTGGEVTCGNPVSDRGLLVGVWPALAYDPTGTLYFAYRDGHDAQFGQQDWNGSDVEEWEGVPPSLTTNHCLAAGGNGGTVDGKPSWGGRIQMTMGPESQPVMVWDRAIGTSDGNGTDVYFQRRKSDGSWSSPANIMLVGNTQSGASIAYDSREGIGVAAVDRSTNELRYTFLPDGSSTWAEPDPVFGSGSGGWFPSLAMDPVYGEPAIAFYVCSPRNSINETNCLTTEDELRIKQRVSGNWREVVVDKEGGYLPKLGFFVDGTGPSATSKRVVVYRQPQSVEQSTGKTVANAGMLKLAVER